MEKNKKNRDEICGITLFISAAIALGSFGPYNWIKDFLDVIIILSLSGIIGIIISGITWITLTLLSPKAQNKINQKYENIQQKVLNFLSEDE